MDSFYDKPIPSKLFFVNAPDARTRREATRCYLKSTTFLEPQPPLSSSEKAIRQITHPASIESIIDRRVVLQRDNKIRKSVRVHLSDLRAEKDALELVRVNTSIPVPRVYDYYKSAEFEHLVIERLPGITLEEAWPTLEVYEKERIADEVVAFLEEIRKLRSPYIKAALLHRKPLRSGIVDAADFNLERFKQFSSNKHISAYVQARIDSLHPQPNVFTHGDLDWSNILVNDKKVSGIIDWESSGYFPAYWEWVTLKRSAETQKTDDSWFYFLSKRVGSSECTYWDGMWQLEQLHKALGQYTQWALTPEDREANRTRGWAKVTKILGLDCGAAPPVNYAISSDHPWWVEKRGERRY
jgi:aminoglycoside phosphotransferase